MSPEPVTVIAMPEVAGGWGDRDNQSVSRLANLLNDHLEPWYSMISYDSYMTSSYGSSVNYIIIVYDIIYIWYT